MSNRIEAPGHTALWTEVALRALTGTATEGMAPDWKDSARAACIVKEAMAIATAFERACEEAHAATIEAAAAKVRAIGRFRSAISGTMLLVESIEGEDVTFALVPGEKQKRVATVDLVLAEDGLFEPAPLDAPAPTPTGGKERA